MTITNITDRLQDIVSKSEIREGLLNVFVAGSTGAITTIEYEPGLMKDLEYALERIAPRNAEYEHEKMWHDGNGHSHVRASMIGPSLTIPITEGKLETGTWQQVVFMELDTRSRDRRLTVTCIGEQSQSPFPQFERSRECL